MHDGQPLMSDRGTPKLFDSVSNYKSGNESSNINAAQMQKGFNVMIPDIPKFETHHFYVAAHRGLLALRHCQHGARLLQQLVEAGAVLDDVSQGVVDAVVEAAAGIIGDTTLILHHAAPGLVDQPVILHAPATNET